ncbi:MAG: hypothetical protein M1830_010028 [Pleopsidium flavum]|nr:MAG: hypothetical protein M1830_010028 [Pleopsidium flavum]
MTAAVSLYRTLPLPQPWTPAQSPIPLIVYGASSAVGAFAVKLAKQSNIHPIIAVAGKGCDFVSTLLDTSKGDAVIDYRPGPDSLFRSIRGALAAAKVSDVGYAFDAISEHGSYEVCGKFIRPGGMLAHVLPLDDGFRLPEGATANLTMVGDVHNVFGEKPGAKDFGCTYMRAFGRGLEAGTLSGHPFEVVPGGLDGIQTGLENLKAGKASALKYLFRIGETNGLAVV